MGKPSRVFVIQDMGFRYDDAGDHFGELIFLLNRNEGNVFNMLRTAAILKKRLWDFGYSNDDYLLAVGAPALIMLAGTLAIAQTTGPLKVLQYDKKDSRYYTVEIPR